MTRAVQKCQDVERHKPRSSQTMNFRTLGTLRDGYVDIAVSTLGSLPKEVRLIDVRQPDEFEGDLGHLDGAELVPLGQLAEISQAWPQDAPLLLICRSGNRSSQAARALRARGFSNLANLAGGMLAVRGGL